MQTKQWVAMTLAAALVSFASGARAQDATQNADADAGVGAATPLPSEPATPAPLEAATRESAEPAPTEPAAPAAAETPEIQVTVVGTPVARTAGSAHVVRSAQLERFKLDDPHAVLSTVPGVYVRGEDGFGLRPNIGIRGVNPDRSKKVTLLEDGILFGPAPYSAPAAYYFPLISRMSQVRVIKGPAAVSFGPQTVGGAIDLITRPIPDTASAGVDLAGGDFFYRKAHGYFGSSDGQTGFLVEGLHLANDGFKELPGGADTGFYRNEWMVKLSRVIDPSADVQNELRLKLSYSDELSNETYLGLTDEDFRADPLRRYNPSQLDRMRNHRTSIVASHVLTPSDEVSLQTHVYRHDFYRVWRKVNRFGNADLFDVLVDHPETERNRLLTSILRGDSDSSTPQDKLFIGPNERDFVSQGIESRLRWDVATGPIAHRMEYGLRFHNDRIDRRHSEDSFDIIAGEPTPDRRTMVTTLNQGWSYALAAYATDAMTWEALTLTPGVRVEAIRSGLDDLKEDLSAARGTYAFVPGIGAYYALTKDFGLLAGVYRGFSPPAPSLTEADVDPEMSVNYEAGARFSRGPARAELIGFYNDYGNLTDQCTFSGGCADAQVDQQFDAGEARIYGFEAFIDYEARLPAALKLPFTLAYTLTQAEFMNTFSSEDPIFGDVEEGDEMPYIPLHQLTGSVGLEHKRAGGALSLAYVAAMREEAGSEPIEDSLATDEQLTMDAALYYRALSAVELYLVARNLFDSHNIVSRRPFGARPNAPRWIEIGVKAEL